ncbi:cell division protein ZapA [Novosphingobium flavum]|uniref:Cell division protein ZapA n=1 Tax=Novosphingobium flavum TaxID=1778672 RepID=A0A7X1FUB0_9SPHN|nr:cell division protein ZapA [Novosphingobium flavum]MBC2666557.1 cell division protein ZapA [Novosphingobium flavum]
MSNVSLHIGGRGFTVACAEGEEAHIAELGRMIDAKLHAMGGAAGQSETRVLLFAALLLADELHEAKNGPGAPPPPPPPPEPKEDLALAEALEEIARRLENCASHLEQLATDA